MIREKHIARTAQAARTARVLRSGFAAFVAGVAALCCAACINDYPDEAAPVRFPDGESIALQVSMFDIIDDADDAVPDVERMHNLRVIITHKEMLDGAEHEVIEYNRLIEFGDGNRKYRYGYVEDPRLMFKIERGTPSEKHIYLFANSEPILNGMLGKGDLASLTAQPDPEAGIYGGNHYDKIGQDIADSYLKALREVTFSKDELQYFVKPDDGSPANGIPMSAEYDIEFNPGNTGIADVYIMNAYIVRAANKITFEYENQRPQYPIFVQNWGLNNVANDAYLLPHVKDGGPLSGTGGDDIRDGSWIKWYADHIKKSNTHAAELNFAVPGTTYNSYNGRSDGKYTYADLSVTEVKPDGSETVIHEEVTGLKVGNMYWDKSGEAIPGKTMDTEVYYFPETRYCPAGRDAQVYTMSFNTLGYNSSPTGGDEKHWTVVGTYDSRPMESVPTLFRNTHVQIRAKFLERDQVELNVSIINWKEKAPVNGNLTQED